jgi:hypothetical protein
VLERLRADGLIPRRLALPFKVGTRRSIAYLQHDAGLEQAKQALAREWTTVAREVLESYPPPEMLDLTADDILDITLQSSHVLNERDELAIVLQKVDSLHKDHFASTRVKERTMTVCMPKDALLTINSNPEALAMQGNTLSEQALQKMDLNALEFNTTTINVGTECELEDISEELFWSYYHRIFEMHKSLAYRLHSVVVYDVQGKSWHRVDNVDYALFALADPRNELMIFPMFSIEVKPAWTAHFEEVRIEHQTEHGPYEEVFIKPLSPELIEWFKQRYPDMRQLYKDPILIPVDFLLRNLSAIRMTLNPAVRLLVEWMDSMHAKLLQPILTMIAEGRISYDFLWYRFPDGCRVACKLPEGDWIALSTIKNDYEQSFGNAGFKLKCSVLRCNGQQFYMDEQEFKIKPFKGAVPLDSLQVRLLTDDISQESLARFDMFERYAMGIQFAHCNGFVDAIGSRVDNTSARQKKSSQFVLDGRVVIDAQLYLQSGHSQIRLSANPTAPLRHVSDEQKMAAWPYVPAFSLKSKGWVCAYVGKLSEIQFADNVFESVVMDAAKKTMLKSLMAEPTPGQFKDLLAGKSRGRILLLHGEPGTGKTLTAEAVAESMRKPLYSVSVGELGIKAKDVESNLMRVLEIAERWSAIILIDEADVFMEQRDHRELVRNSLVANFLRALDCYDGIMFLTTNRVQHFDQAMIDRAMLILEYPMLTPNQRQQVWRNLLKAMLPERIEEFEPFIKQVAELQVNGRRINRVLAWASQLATAAQQPLQPRHILDSIAAETHSSKLKRKQSD